MGSVKFSASEPIYISWVNWNTIPVRKSDRLRTSDKICFTFWSSNKKKKWSESKYVFFFLSSSLLTSVIGVIFIHMHEMNLGIISFRSSVTLKS